MASWPATFLMGPGAASGVALINSVGSVGGFLGPYILGALTTHHDDFTPDASLPYDEKQMHCVQCVPVDN